MANSLLDNPAAKIIGGALLLLGIGAWGAGLLQRKAEMTHFLTNGTPVMDPAEIPTVEGLMELSTILGREVFPPQYDKAKEALTLAIQMEPYRSDLWMEVARVQLFSGKRPQAEAALKWSDDIDPYYPRQRSEAILLWTLMGKSDRAEEIARSLARLGGPTLIESALTLRRAGYTPSQIFTRLELENWGPEMGLNIINRLGPTDRRQIEELFAVIPEPWLEDDVFRAEIARYALTPLNTKLAMDLWTRSSNSIVTQHNGGAELMVENTALETSPFGTYFPLGWNRPINNSVVTMSWLTNRGQRQGTNAIEIRYNNSRNSSPESIWSFYSVILPAEVGLTARLGINALPPELTEVILQGRADRQEWRTRPSDYRIEGWQTLEVTVPPAETDRVVTLTVRKRHRVGSDLRPSTLLLDGVELIPFKAAPGEGNQ